MFNERQATLVKAEIAALTNLIGILDSIGATAEDTLELKKSIDQLKDLFLLVIIGEFNSGKSSFLNALLGKKWLEEGVTPTTAQVNILRNGPEFQVVQRSGLVHGLAKQDEHVEVHVPVPWLKQISLVDTPGTNAVVQGHQEITEHFVPRSDLVLFVTSCDRAFTESERTFLERVKQYNKKVVVVLSKIDSLEDPEKDLPVILNFVNAQTQRLFGFVPQIFPVSSRLALKAKIAAAQKQSLDHHPSTRDLALEQSKEWADSRFGPLESYILHTLNAQERGKLKLQNPLGIAEHFIRKYQVDQEQRSKLIKEDLGTLERIDNEIEAFRAELMAEYSYHEDRMDSVLYAMAERARAFLDEQLALTNALKLTNSEELKNQFEKRVVADATSQIDAYINDMIDWMMTKQAKQWSRVVEFATQRQQISNLMAKSQASQEMVGSLKSQYTYNRSVMISGLGEGAKKVINEFDKRKEADVIAATVKAAIYQTAAIEIGVVGIVCAHLNGLFTPLLPKGPTTYDSFSTAADALLSAPSAMPIWPILHDLMAAPLLQGTWITISLMDLTGLVGMTALAAAGLVLLPYRKRQLHANLAAQISDIRLKLKNSLKSHFDHELQKGVSELKENISPYSRLVQSERAKLEAAGTQLAEVSRTLEGIRRDIDVSFR